MTISPSGNTATWNYVDQNGNSRRVTVDTRSGLGVGRNGTPAEVLVSETIVIVHSNGLNTYFDVAPSGRPVRRAQQPGGSNRRPDPTRMSDSGPDYGQGRSGSTNLGEASGLASRRGSYVSKESTYFPTASAAMKARGSMKGLRLIQNDAFLDTRGHYWRTMQEAANAGVKPSELERIFAYGRRGKRGTTVLSQAVANQNGSGSAKGVSGFVNPRGDFWRTKALAYQDGASLNTLRLGIEIIVNGKKVIAVQTAGNKYVAINGVQLGWVDKTGRFWNTMEEAVAAGVPAKTLRPGAQRTVDGKKMTGVGTPLTGFKLVSFVAKKAPK